MRRPAGALGVGPVLRRPAGTLGVGPVLRRPAGALGVGPVLTLNCELMGTGFVVPSWAIPPSGCVFDITSGAALPKGPDGCVQLPTDGAFEINDNELMHLTRHRLRNLCRMAPSQVAWGVPLSIGGVLVSVTVALVFISMLDLNNVATHLGTTCRVWHGVVHAAIKRQTAVSIGLARIDGSSMDAVSADRNVRIGGEGATRLRRLRPLLRAYRD